MKSKRKILFGAGAVLILVAVAALMMVIGRGHTVYLDNKTLDYNGQTYSALYKIKVFVGGEQLTTLNARDRGMSTCIGQNFEMTLEITAEKGGTEETKTFQVKLPYSIDGIVINLPAYLAGLPEEAWQSEFVPANTEEDPNEVPNTGDELGGELGDELGGEFAG